MVANGSRGTQRARTRGAQETRVVKQLRAFPADLRESPEAGNALILARCLDEGIADRELPAIVRELRLTMAELRELAPAEAEGDFVDELRERRAHRTG